MEFENNGPEGSLYHNHWDDHERQEDFEPGLGQQNDEIQQRRAEKENLYAGEEQPGEEELVISDEDTNQAEYVGHQEDNVQDDGDGGVESGTL